MEAPEAVVEQAWLLVSRLERLSADSVWAHRASGVRGALLKAISQLEQAGASPTQEALQQLRAISAYGFLILEKAAQELLK
jgi:hypothetical protein